MAKITIIRALKKLWNASTELLAGKQDKLRAGSNIIINGNNLSVILDTLKSEGVDIPLRAFVTLHSQEWPLNRLIDELERERKELGG